MQVRKFFGRNVAALTEEWGDKKMLADQVGITVQQLNNIIRANSLKGCALDTAWNIAHALGYSLDDMCLPPKSFKKKTGEKDD